MMRSLSRSESKIIFFLLLISSQRWFNAWWHISVASFSFHSVCFRSSAVVRVFLRTLIACNLRVFWQNHPLLILVCNVLNVVSCLDSFPLPRLLLLNLLHSVASFRLDFQIFFKESLLGDWLISLLKFSISNWLSWFWPWIVPFVLDRMKVILFEIWNFRTTWSA